MVSVKRKEDSPPRGAAKNVNVVGLHEEHLLDFAGVGRWVSQCAEARMRDLVSDAAITGTALVRHLDDARFACLRALR